MTTTFDIGNASCPKLEGEVAEAINQVESDLRIRINQLTERVEKLEKIHLTCVPSLPMTDTPIYKCPTCGNPLNYCTCMRSHTR